MGGGDGGGSGGGSGLRCLRGVADWPLGEADTAMPFTSFASGADDPSVVGAAEGGKSLHSE